MLDAVEDSDKSLNAPTRTYVRDAKAMAATPADVKEYPNAYAFIIDMPGLKSGDIKVQVEDDNVLMISGERKREEEKEGAKYVRMERRVGKFMRKFVLPENANTDKISAVCQDGVLTVTVEKLPPPEPKKPKTIENLPLFPNSVFYKNHTTTYDFLQHSGTSTFAVVHNLTRQISETQHGFEDDGLRFSTLLCPPTQARRRRRLRQVRQRTHSHLRPRRQAMAATLADVKEYPNSYTFIVVINQTL
ncbi:17.9 kDa class II heat shock protein [Vitis vinifera]|uniref:17.9 kDa class II heat shock protein n=1 Tax=Vitis vinifera TaxID=29760 RepID=A0A438EXH2_VITVI|nr:17.9 kDa class II heat shock protein [Vitis vinifera]